MSEISSAIKSDVNFYKEVLKETCHLLDIYNEKGLSALKSEIEKMVEESFNKEYSCGHNCDGFVLSVLDKVKLNSDDECFFFIKDLINFIEDFPDNMKKDEELLAIDNHILLDKSETLSDVEQIYF